MSSMSKGALTDIAVLSMASAVFKVSLEIEAGSVDGGDGVVCRVPKETRERLDGWMRQIVDRFVAIYGALTRKQRQIVRAKQDGVFRVFVREAPQEVQLDLFAVYLLQQRFAERSKPLHPSMAWYRNHDLYDGIRDAVVEALAGSVGREVAERRDGEMFEAAYRIANAI